MTYRTEQEIFWAGTFGDQYIERNKGAQIVASNTALFTSILRHCGALSSVIEFGANIGLNLVALHSLLPEAKFSAVEINAKAADSLRELGFVSVEQRSILDPVEVPPHDLSFVKTVLIHIEPTHLPAAYDALYRSARRFIVVAEYYNPLPVEVAYRGHKERLFKRDFAGEMMKRFSDLKLIDYGFVYHGGRFPQDDITWFLMEKTA